jgi:hypothetical protein
MALVTMAYQPSRVLLNRLGIARPPLRLLMPPLTALTQEFVSSTRAFSGAARPPKGLTVEGPERARPV